MISLNPLILPTHSEFPLDWYQHFGRKAPIDVEIGFGCGEVLVRLAQEHPERNFVGIEQHWERIYKTLKTITKINEATPNKIKNIKILRMDARVAFERVFAGESIDHIYSLFPCPWPKKGHIKHRLFSQDFLQLLNSRLKQGQDVKIVTDFHPYFEWIQEHIQQTGFQVQADITKTQYDTKFERKWKEEGQEEFYELRLVKQEHKDISLKEGTPLKSYKLDNFDSSRFSMENETGEVSVVFKDMIFDPERQKAMVLVIVAEPDMTQHLWVVIMKKQGTWRICRADGQNFFPTPGIARALECVYLAAERTV